MFKSRGFWYFMMAGAIGGWIFIVAGLIKPFKNESMKKLWKLVAPVFMLGHPVEILISKGIGRAAGISLARTVIKTLVYGFTWWLPVKLGVFKK